MDGGTGDAGAEDGHADWLMHCEYCIGFGGGDIWPRRVARTRLHVIIHLLCRRPGYSRFDIIPIGKPFSRTKDGNHVDAITVVQLASAVLAVLCIAVIIMRRKKKKQKQAEDDF